MTSELAAIEQRVIGAGKTVRDLLYLADIDPSLWYRWTRMNKTIRRSSLKRLQDAADKIAPKAKR